MIEKRLEEIQDDLRDIKDDLRGMREKLYDDTTDLKLKQARCDSNWNIVKQIIGFGGLGSAISYLWAKIQGG